VSCGDDIDLRDFDFDMMYDDRRIGILRSSQSLIGRGSDGPRVLCLVRMFPFASLMCVM
jgi:hypothetical protein